MINVLKDRVLTCIGAVGLSLAVFLAFAYPSVADAQTPYVIGGTVAFSYFCPCSGNFLVTVLGPNPGTFSYYPFTQGFLNFNLPRVGVFIVGAYTPGTGVCLVPSPPTGCVPFGFPIGTITPMVGTSL